MIGKVVLRRIGEDRLLVPVLGAVAREGCVFPVNATGEFIWTGLAKGQTLEETAAAVAAEFAVAPDAARADCREFADKLVAQRLLEVAG
ncbi:MAG TPA: PqqD family peptide modification chaperone [Kiritimatiellia bacterium]|nr:PqqD family peptide modification chaperone [Kiritimatiellia bacterium]